MTYTHAKGHSVKVREEMDGQTDRQKWLQCITSCANAVSKFFGFGLWEWNWHIHCSVYWSCWWSIVVIDFICFFFKIIKWLGHVDAMCCVFFFMQHYHIHTVAHQYCVNSYWPALSVTVGQFQPLACRSLQILSKLQILHSNRDHQLLCGWSYIPPNRSVMDRRFWQNLVHWWVLSCRSLSANKIQQIFHIHDGGWQPSWKWKTTISLKHLTDFTKIWYADA